MPTAAFRPSASEPDVQAERPGRPAVKETFAMGDIVFIIIMVAALALFFFLRRKGILPG